jgi:hypothetical protein
LSNAVPAPISEPSLGVGQITDDTQMSMFTAEGLILAERPGADHDLVEQHCSARSKVASSSNSFRSTTTRPS